MLDRDERRWLEKTVQGRVRFNEPMSAHTSFKVGGPAEAFVAPQNQMELTQIVRWTWENQIEYLIAGDGTNLLVKDSGIKGIVINLTRGLKEIAMKTSSDKKEGEDAFVTAQAGGRLQTLCRYAIDQGIKGMNFALGIPGTVGGAITMNAGTSHGAMEQVVVSVKAVLPTGKVEEVKREKMDFSYRKLQWEKRLRDYFPKFPIVIEGCLALKNGNRQALKAEADKIANGRKLTQPAGSSSAGCFFKNPISGKTAGELIEMAGLKGEMVGDAMVSKKHANFIINCGRASAADVLSLKAKIQDKVARLYHINLEPEVKIVG